MNLLIIDESSNVSFLFFSDDISWCKENFSKKNVFFIEGNSAIIDFTLMSKCDHNVITPSSFSWWASWLNRNKNKIIIMPEGRLFGIDGPNQIDDYLYNGIKRISVD